MGVFKYLHIDWREVVGLLVLTLLGAATEMGLPTMLARMIDDGVTRQHLLREKHLSEAGKTSPDCRKQCLGCGASCLTKEGRCDA